mmetsp:Transcript_10876/g.23301  ORF Transcript_10876/g.23301 Transcript_10876/m.23301 type:complete len:227 (-) Transcript_10876:256-936(-)
MGMLHDVFVGLFDLVSHPGDEGGEGFFLLVAVCFHGVFGHPAVLGDVIPQLIQLVVPRAGLRELQVEDLAGPHSDVLRGGFERRVQSQQFVLLGIKFFLQRLQLAQGVSLLASDALSFFHGGVTMRVGDGEGGRGVFRKQRFAKRVDQIGVIFFGGIHIRQCGMIGGIVRNAAREGRLVGRGFGGVSFAFSSRRKWCDDDARLQLSFVRIPSVGGSSLSCRVGCRC